MGTITGIYVVIQGVCLVVASAVGCSALIINYTLDKTSGKKGNRHVG